MLLPKVKLKTLVSFPAAVYGGAGIAMVQQNGSYTFSIDFAEYPVVSSIPTPDLPNTKVLTYNVVSKAYLNAPYGGGGTPGGGRQLLTTTQFYYVSPTGNDTNDGSIGFPWATIQNAVNYCNAHLDFGGQQVVIQLADGTYNQAVGQNQPNVGGGGILIQGNTSNQGAVVINIPSGQGGVICQNGGTLNLQYLTFTGGAACLQGLPGGTIKVGYITFGPCPGGIHLYSLPTGFVWCRNGPATISGANGYHVNGQGGFIGIATPITFVSASFVTFVAAGDACAIGAQASSFTGTFTGKRYDISGNSICETGTGNINLFPGTIAGTTATGGQYL